MYFHTQNCILHVCVILAQIASASCTLSTVANGCKETWEVSQLSRLSKNCRCSMPTFQRYHLYWLHLLFLYLFSLASVDFCCWTYFVYVNVQIEALPQLTIRQLADMSATPGQLTTSTMVEMVMRHIPNQNLPTFFDFYSQAIMVTAHQKFQMDNFFSWFVCGESMNKTGKKLPSVYSLQIFLQQIRNCRQDFNTVFPRVGHFDRCNNAGVKEILWLSSPHFDDCSWHNSDIGKYKREKNTEIVSFR